MFTAGIGLEIWRSLKLVGMGYGMAILAAIPIGFLLGGSYRFARMFDPIFQILRHISFPSEASTAERGLPMAKRDHTDMQFLSTWRWKVNFQPRAAALSQTSFLAK